MVAHGLRFLQGVWGLPGLGIELVFLPWQADSCPPHHQGRPRTSALALCSVFAPSPSSRRPHHCKVGELYSRTEGPPHPEPQMFHLTDIRVCRAWCCLRGSRPRECGAEATWPVPSGKAPGGDRGSARPLSGEVACGLLGEQCAGPREPQEPRCAGCAAQRPWASCWGLWVLGSGRVSCSVVSDSLRPHGLYEAHQAPLSMSFSRQGILEWVAISSSRGSSRPRVQTHIPCPRRQILYHLSLQGSPGWWRMLQTRLPGPGSESAGSQPLPSALGAAVLVGHPLC